MNGTIDDLCETIRRWLLEGQSQVGGQLRSSLDVIEDCQLALEGYSQSRSSPGSGECYLKVYGVLQVLYVQQDAVANLFEALGRPYTRSNILKEIRDTRNRATGHPSKRGSGTKASFHFIPRMTLSDESFEIVTEAAGANDQREEIDIHALMRSQAQQLAMAHAALVAGLGPNQ
jgi:hypothetical protein